MAELVTLLAVLGVTDGGILQGGQVVLVDGVAGVGKTRIAAEVMTAADGAGWQVLLGHCSLTATAVPYFPLREAFGRLEVADPTRAADLLARWPALAAVFPDGGVESAAASSPRLPTDLIDAVWCALEFLSRDIPALLVVEDAHWADASTRALLTELFRRVPYASLSVLVTYRLDALSRAHPLRNDVAQWSSLSGVSEVSVRPLPPSDAQQLARALLPGTGDETRRRVVERAEGNPFYLEQLAAAARGGEQDLPRTLVDLLGRRVSALGPVSRSVVRALAVGGGMGRRDLVQRVTGFGDDEVDEAIDQAIDHFVLSTADSGVLRFRHALLAEAVYAGIKAVDRVALHRAFADVYLSRDARGQPGAAAELARHARAAGDYRTSAEASIRAARDAEAAGGPAEASRHYQDAILLLAEVHDPDTALRCELVLASSASAVAAGDVHGASDMLVDAIDALPVEVDDEHRARLLLARAQVSLILDSDLDGALAATTGALQLIPTGEPSALRARTLAAHAQACFARGWTEQGEAAADEALTIGRHLGLPDVLAEVHATIASRTDRLEGARAETVLLDTITQAQAAGEIEAELVARQQLGHHLAEVGRLQDAQHTYTEMVRRARSTGRSWSPHGTDGRMMAAQMAYLRGRWDEALTLAETREEQPPASARAVLVTASLPVLAGRGEQAGGEILRGLQGRLQGNVVAAITSGTAAIDLFGDGGDIDGARAAHAALIAELTQMWGGSVFAVRIRLGGLLIGQLAVDVPVEPGDRLRVLAEAAALREAAETAAATSRQGLESRAWLARVRAEHLRLRHRAGQPDEPGQLVRAWEEAVAAFTAYGHIFEVARSRVRLAAALLVDGRSDEAAAELHAVNITASELIARPLLAELRAIGGLLPGRSDDPEGLTARELQVLALVSQGRSNSQIGAQLFISAKTVSVHVSNILAKLHASSRTEAVFIARRRGLLPAELR